MQRRIIMEVFTLIARKKNVALVFVSYLLVALAAISLLTICIGFAPGILFAVVFGLIAYLMIMAQNTEFEYSYFDGELRFAKIKNKSRRKRLGIYSMESVAAIAGASPIRFHKAIQSGRHGPWTPAMSGRWAMPER